MNELRDFIFHPQPLILTGINFIMCMCVLYGCLCRLRLTSIDTKISPRMIYSFITILMIVSALRGPLLGNQITQWWPILLTLALWLVMLANMGSWQDGSPPPAMQKSGQTRPAPLDITLRELN